MFQRKLGICLIKLLISSMLLYFLIFASKKTFKFYRPETQYLETLNYNFSNTWFKNQVYNWHNHCQNFAQFPKRILEIGAFEGASTTWFLDNLLKHKKSRIVSIDTFEGSVEHKDNPQIVEALEKRFKYNISICKGKHKLSVIKGKSTENLAKLLVNKTPKFDLIYIDGSHFASDVLQDAIGSWPLLKDGGFLVFDDYLWDWYEDPSHNPRLAIDSFLSCFKNQFEIVESNYQIWIRKTKGKYLQLVRKHP